MNCCDYDCNQGRDCPARQTPYRPTPGELRAQRFQAETDRAAAQACTANRGDLPTPTGPLSDDTPEGPGALVAAGHLAAVALAMWFVVFILLPVLAGLWWGGKA